MLREYQNDYVVYLHKNPETGIVFYVGIGRPDRAYKMVGRGKRWHVYVDKYGRPIVEVYRTKLNVFEALYLESHLIKVYGRRKIDPDGILVNVTAGGDATVGLFGEFNPMYGKTHNSAARLKISQTHKGKTISEATKKIWSEQRMGAANAMFGKPRCEKTKKAVAKANKLRKLKRLGFLNIKQGKLF